MKTCSKCKKEKALDSFYKNKRMKGGFDNYCKNCREEVKAEYTPVDYQKNYNKKYYDSNKHFLLEQRKVYYREVMKDQKLQKKYNISLAYFNEMFERQKSQCAICKIDFGGVKCCVDHDHKTGQVRGLLCGNCNLALGNFRDNVVSMREAINYIQVWSL